MALTLVSAPAALPLTLQEAKQHLKVEDDDTSEDSLIAALIRAATAHIDGRDGWLGKALITQTWDYVLDAFPCPRTPARGFQGPYFAADAIRLPLAPVQSVSSVTYLDGDGTEQTLATSKYVVDIKSEPARVVPAFDQIWPVTRDQINAVTVRFVCGFGNTGSDVPQDIRNALLLMIMHWFEHRSSVEVGGAMSQVPETANAILSKYWRPFA